jgi:hypothetical protein
VRVRRFAEAENLTIIAEYVEAETGSRINMGEEYEVQYWTKHLAGAHRAGASS